MWGLTGLKTPRGHFVCNFATFWAQVDGIKMETRFGLLRKKWWIYVMIWVIGQSVPVLIRTGTSKPQWSTLGEKPTCSQYQSSSYKADLIKWSVPCLFSLFYVFFSPSISLNPLQYLFCVYDLTLQKQNLSKKNILAQMFTIRLLAIFAPSAASTTLSSTRSLAETKNPHAISKIPRS